MNRRFGPRLSVEALLGLGTLALLGIAAVLVWYEPLLPKPSLAFTPLDVRATDIDGKVRVDWDPELPVVRDAQGGTLEALDGGVMNRYPMEKRVLRSGSFDYIRQSDDVLLTMTLYRAGKPSAGSRIRSIGPVPISVAPVVGRSSQTRGPQARPRDEQRRRGTNSRTRRR